MGTNGRIYQEISIRLQYRFTAHCRVILVLKDSCLKIVKGANKQTMVGKKSIRIIEKGINLHTWYPVNHLTWYDRAVTKREPAASIPKALPWLNPDNRNIGVDKVRWHTDAEEEGSIERFDT